jgi:hypothetical protein
MIQGEIGMINKDLAREAVDGHVKFRSAVENGLAERFELGEKLKAVLDKIDSIANEMAEIANVLLPGNASPAELAEVKRATFAYAEAWRKWTGKVREDIRTRLGND